MGVYDNPPKVQTKDSGKAGGIFIDIIEYIEREENWEIEYVHGTWDEGLTRLEKGEIDLMPDVAFSETRDTRFDFNKLTVLSSWQQAYCRRGDTVESIADFDGAVVAVLKGSIQQQVMADIGKNFGLDLKLLKLPDYNATLEAVESGKADIVVVSRFYAYGHRRESVVATPILFNPSTLHFAAPEGKNAKLLAAIDKHIAELLNDGNSVYYKSLTTWLHEKPRFFIPLYVRWSVVGISIAVILLVVISLLLKWRVTVRTRELSEKNAQLESALQQLEAVQDEALKRERLYAFGQLASGLAHDFNNLLVPIMGYTEIAMAETDKQENSCQTREDLEKILTATKHGREIIGRMQQFYSSVKDNEEKKPVDLNVVIRDAVELARARWKRPGEKKARHIDVVFNLDADKRIEGRQSVLHEMFLNLMINATDAMPKGGTIEIYTENITDAVKITVKDNGVGMSEELVEKCMQPFFTTKGSKGTGMGLTMVANIVKEYNGTIKIISKNGKGTSIIITIPDTESDFSRS